MGVGDRYQIVGNEGYTVHGDLKKVYLVADEVNDLDVYGRLFYTNNGLPADIILGVSGRPRFSKSHVQLIKEELKFGDRCVAWDDSNDEDEHIFICNTPHGVMVADVDDYDEILNDVKTYAGGEYWFGFYKHAKPIKVREMTVTEIEEALGFSVKIVKGDK